MNLQEVHSVSIYPAIGIARVGNSPDEYFIGPTIPGQSVVDPDDFRDPMGRIKRQAAKFYIYAKDKDGNILGELTEEHGVKIDWKVDVANKKAAWYNFDIALDIPTAEGKYDMDGNPTPGGLPVLSQRRNQDFVGDDRKLLMIEARALHITGRDTNPDGSKYHLKGKIGRSGEEVYLGELRTDGDGRLIFLGGRGHSASFTVPASDLTTFANNQGWHDDTSDGPVDATVIFPDDRKLEAEGAWVLTAPPNYAVGVQAFSTGYDLLVDVASRMHPGIKKETPEFYADIFPVLKYLSINQWVNVGVSREFGWGSAYNFEDEELLVRLLDKSPQNRPFRQTIFESFRNPNYKEMEPQSWPPLYGDAVTFNINSTDPRNWYAITELKYQYLKQWAEGDYTIDDAPRERRWQNMSPTEQANGLTEAALEETLGGPFHPGCEFTWPMRHNIMYDGDSPFRIKRRANAKEDFGVAISHDIALAPGGPLDGCSPGDITKWMAVPWQTDTSSCLSAYKGYAGEYLPTFWPARVPNDVLTLEDFHTIEHATDPNTRIEAFSPSNRKKWLRGFIYDDEGNVLPGRFTDGIEKFTKDWWEIGIIVKKALPNNAPFFPHEVWVETGRAVQKDLIEAAGLIAAAAPSKTAKKGLRPDWYYMNPRHLR
ncbi:MAG: LodA/GoxA family CTQ-dependent oxidase [Bacteroidota bacterium]